MLDVRPITTWIGISDGVKRHHTQAGRAGAAEAGSSLAIRASTCIGSRSRRRPGASVSSYSSMIIDR
jgi:hypothetical protein